MQLELFGDVAAPVVARISDREWLAILWESVRFARRSGKAVPDWAAYRSLWSSRGVGCSVCLRAWEPRRGVDKSRRPSLQHWPDGSFGWSCNGCNTVEFALREEPELLWLRGADPERYRLEMARRYRARRARCARAYWRRNRVALNRCKAERRAGLSGDALEAFRARRREWKRRSLERRRAAAAAESV